MKQQHKFLLGLLSLISTTMTDYLFAPPKIDQLPASNIFFLNQEGKTEELFSDFDKELLTKKDSSYKALLIALAKTFPQLLIQDPESFFLTVVITYFQGNYFCYFYKTPKILSDINLYELANQKTRNPWFNAPIFKGKSLLELKLPRLTSKAIKLSFIVCQNGGVIKAPSIASNFQVSLGIEADARRTAIDRDELRVINLLKGSLETDLNPLVQDACHDLATIFRERTIEKEGEPRVEDPSFISRELESKLTEATALSIYKKTPHLLMIYETSNQENVSRPKIEIVLMKEDLIEKLKQALLTKNIQTYNQFITIASHNLTSIGKNSCKIACIFIPIIPDSSTPKSLIAPVNTYINETPSIGQTFIKDHWTLLINAQRNILSLHKQITPFTEDFFAGKWEERIAPICKSMADLEAKVKKSEPETVAKPREPKPKKVPAPGKTRAKEETSITCPDLSSDDMSKICSQGTSEVQPIQDPSEQSSPSPAVLDRVVKTPEKITPPAADKSALELLKERVELAKADVIRKLQEFKKAMENEGDPIIPDKGSSLEALPKEGAILISELQNILSQAKKKKPNQRELIIQESKLNEKGKGIHLFNLHFSSAMGAIAKIIDRKTKAKAAKCTDQDTIRIAEKETAPTVDSPHQSKTPGIEADTSTELTQKDPETVKLVFKKCIKTVTSLQEGLPKIKGLLKTMAEESQAQMEAAIKEIEKNVDLLTQELTSEAPRVEIMDRLRKTLRIQTIELDSLHQELIKKTKAPSSFASTEQTEPSIVRPRVPFQLLSKENIPPCRQRSLSFPLFRPFQASDVNPRYAPLKNLPGCFELSKEKWLDFFKQDSEEGLVSWIIKFFTENNEFERKSLFEDQLAKQKGFAFAYPKFDLYGIKIIAEDGCEKYFINYQTDLYKKPERLDFLRTYGTPIQYKHIIDQIKKMIKEASPKTVTPLAA